MQARNLDEKVRFVKVLITGSKYYSVKIMLRLKMPLTGFEINESAVKAVQLKKDKNGWRLLQRETEFFHKGTISPSYNEKNINDSQKFLETIKRVLGRIKGRVSRIGLSVPNDIVKISIQKFNDLPKSGLETEKMISWWAKKSFRFPVERARISYSLVGRNMDGGENLLIAVGLQDVIKDYELNLKKLKISAEIIQPASINHFNFYRNQIDTDGIIVFIGIFENYHSFFVFEDAQLIFYHGVRGGDSDIYFVQDIDLIIQHYMNINPDKKLEKLYIGSQVGSYREIEEKIKNICDLKVSFIDAARLIIDESQPTKMAAGSNGAREEDMLSSFVSAIGAAQSLVQ